MEGRQGRTLQTRPLKDIAYRVIAAVSNSHDENCGTQLTLLKMRMRWEGVAGYEYSRIGGVIEESEGDINNRQ